MEVVRRLCDLKADVEAEKTQGGRSQGGSISRVNGISVTFIDTKAYSSNYWEREAYVIMCVFGSLALERMPDIQSVTSTV